MRVAAMEFYLEAFTNHKEQALRAYRQGDSPEAQYHFLQAARYLALAAQKSEGKLRAIRLAFSKKPQEIARSLKGQDTCRLEWMCRAMRKQDRPGC